MDFINHCMRCLSEFYLQNQAQSAGLKNWVKQKDVSGGGRYRGLCSSQYGSDFMSLVISDVEE